MKGNAIPYSCVQTASTRCSLWAQGRTETESRCICLFVLTRRGSQISTGTDCERWNKTKRRQRDDWPGAWVMTVLWERRESQTGFMRLVWFIIRLKSCSDSTEEITSCYVGTASEKLFSWFIVMKFLVEWVFDRSDSRLREPVNKNRDGSKQNVAS